MSRTIDERVVEMRFDNKQFEAGAKQSIGTLSRLKEALNISTGDSAKSLEKFNQAMSNTSLDGLTAGVEALQRRFSTLGIMGMRIIENITDSMMNNLGRAINFVTDSIVSGGIRRAMNIENAHFQLQALLKDEEKVQAVMADAMESVDGTAYAYDEAAKAAAQFAASGLQAGEEMLGALKGITGVAAMTNSDFESISQIFTTVAGNGRLMGDQLLQLSSRGLNAASTIAEYFKEVRDQANMTESDIREMVTKGKLDFQTFSDAMTWAFGDSAKRANETFTGALANMKSALARIGAGFISPLVEQNSEMVKLFNALREQINNVKTALVFDEQTSALSGMTKQAELMVETVSGFAKDGTIEFEKFTNAILDSSKSETELAEINEFLSDSYNKVKESGSATVDTLIDFNKNNINMSMAITDYINGVLNGTIKASTAVKKSVEEITDGTEIIVGDVTRLAQEGKISYDLFTSALVNSSGVIKKESEIVGETVKALMSSIKESGTVTADNLMELNQNGFKVAQSINKYVTGVANGTIRASYSMTQAVEEMVDENGRLSDTVLNLAKEGKISYDILQAAMEETYGDQRALSKQFTDFFLDNVKSLVATIESIDMSGPMEVFYYWAESTKNVMKGLLSVLKPIGGAFVEAFSSFSGEGIINLAAKIEKVTRSMTLNDKASQGLRDAFKGIFSVGKLVVDIFADLLAIFIPMRTPLNNITEGIFGLAGAIGRSLTSFTQWFRGSTKIHDSYTFISNSVRSAMVSFNSFITTIGNLAYEIYQLEPVQELIGNIVQGFKNLGLSAYDGVAQINNKLVEFKMAIFDLFPSLSEDGLKGLISDLASGMNDFIKNLRNINLSSPKEAITSFKDVLKGMLEVLMSNEGLNTFVTNMREFFGRLEEAFSIETITEKIATFRKTVDEFVEWIINMLTPLAKVFSDFSLGGAIATGGGVGLIYAIVKMAKSFEKVASTMEKIPDLLGSFKGVLVEYQNNLKADSLKKVAAAILMLSGALVLLSFADLDRVLKASIALSLTAGVLMAGVNKFIDVAEKTKTVNDATYMFAKAANNITKGIKWKLIGSTFKDFATSILIIVGSLIAVTLMYRKDPEGVMMAADIVEYIGGTMLAVIGVMSIIGQVFGKGMKSFQKAASGVLALSLSLIVVITALQKLFKMELPSDYQEKIDILYGLFNALAGIVLIVGLASLLSGGNKLNPAPIIALAAMLYLSTIALNKLFKMELPSDYQEKIDILYGLFNALAGLMLAIGGSAFMAGQNGFKGVASSILAMCAFVGVAVGALIILSIFPAEKMMAGAKALGLILVAVGVALYGAGKITTKDTYKSVLSMVVGIGAVVVALGVLSMVPWKALLKSGIALGAVLTIIAADLAAAGQIKNDNVYKSVAAMVATIGAVAISLAILSQYPWDSLLAAAVGLSGTLLALSGAMMIISKAAVDTTDIIAFVAGAVALIPMAYVLNMLAGNDWDEILPATLALGATMLGLSAVMALLSIAKIDPLAILAFVAGAVALVPIAYVLQTLAGLKWQDVAAALIELAAALTIIGVAGAVAGPLAPLILLLSGALIVFGIAIAAVGVGLVAFITSLVISMELLQKLPSAFKGILEECFKVGANVIAGIIQGILSGIEALWEIVEGIGKGIISRVKGVLGIASPSKAMYEIGMYTDEGLANGITDGGDMVGTAIGAVTNIIFGKVKETDLYSAGQGMIGELANGLSSNQETISSAAGNALSAVADAVNQTDFHSSGEQASDNWLSGLVSGNIPEQFQSYVNIDGLDLSSFYSAGESGSTEFLNGLNTGDFDYSSILAGEGLTNVDLSQFNMSGEQASTEFITGFQNGSSNLANEAAMDVAAAFCEAILQSFQDKLPDTTMEIQTELMTGIAKQNPMLTKTGEESADSWLTGIESRYSHATATGLEIALLVIKAIQSKLPDFFKEGNNSATKYLDGIKKYYPDATTVGNDLAKSVKNGIEKIDFEVIGKDAGKGFVSGIASMEKLAAEAGKAIGNATYDASRKALDEHSPSRKMAEVGEFAGLGYVNRLMYFVAKAANAGEDLGNATIKGASDAINHISRVITDDMISDPVIRPIVDLSDVRRSTSDISKLFNEAIGISAENASSVSGAITASRARKVEAEIQNRKETGKQTVFNFEQNNYSPKALSSVEIYRQTKNQISMVKGALSHA